MNFRHNNSGKAWACLAGIAAFSSILSIGHACMAQTGTLAEPFPAHTSNAALHYQRALLHLANVHGQKTRFVGKPVWEVISVVSSQKDASHDFRKLLQSTRFAIRSAAKGSRAGNCDFGIDFSESGASTQLPHVEGMVRLGRLMTLRGVQAELNGNWEEAAVIYFDGLRMGRHMTHQNTLLEAFAGIQILRNNYFALARWGTRCPKRVLVARAFGLLESLQGSLIDPPQVLAREASIMSLEFGQLRNEYPNGDWARRILESVGKLSTGDTSVDRKHAIDACIKNGVPKAVFNSPSAFRNYVDDLRASGHQFAESVSACVTLPAPARVKRAQALKSKYSKLITILANDTLIDPVEISVLLSEYETELAISRIALAIAATKSKVGIPPTLDAVAARFGGVVPPSPYSGKPVAYSVLDDGSFELTFAAVGDFPLVKFSSSEPQLSK